VKLLFGSKDGGPESRVHMYGLESKRFGSVLLLRFGHGTREVYHSHAYDCVSRVLSGALFEDQMVGRGVYSARQLLPRKGWFKTPRECMHQVTGLEPVTWVFTLRGPWADTWREYDPRKGYVTLTHGRKEV
jgi:hypothetical protein